MLLNDRDIRDLCVEGPTPGVAVTHPMIEPFSEGVSGNGVISYGLSHAGYDLRLAQEFWVFKNTYGEVLDPKGFRDQLYVDRMLDKIILEEGKPFHLDSHCFALARSLEYLRIPRRLKARCVGKSTLARCGVLINTTPLEPGWRGYLVIEIGNTSPSTVRLYPGEGIAQLEFEMLTAEPEKDYGQKRGKYMDQEGVTPAKVL